MLIRTSPVLLAVVIGIIELIILEIFRVSLNAALSARRMAKLHYEGRLHLHTAAIQRSRLDLRVTMTSIVLIIVIIVLDLSIDGTSARKTSNTILEKCFAPQRKSRYIGGFGANPSQAQDPRFEDYLERTECKDTLLEAALSDASALERGYPRCAPKFGPVKAREFRTELRGCGVGHVGNTAAEDFHCDLLPVGLEQKSTVNGTSFVAVLESLDDAVGNLDFGDSSKRLILNARTPSSWLVSSTDNVIEVPCDKGTDPVDCYDRAREMAAPEEKTTRSSQSIGGVYMQVLQNGESAICLFENSMQSTAEWLVIHQDIPEADERDRREGPVPTGFVVKGNARCIEGIDERTARLYYDAVENAINVPRPEEMISWLQRYAVATGINTPPSNADSCRVFDVTEGSLINTGWFITGIVITAIISLLSLAAIMYVVYTMLTCPTKIDPLTPLWSIRELLKAKGALRASLDVTNHRTDVYIGVVEDEESAWFDVHEGPEFYTVRRSRLPFRL